MRRVDDRSPVENRRRDLPLAGLRPWRLGTLADLAARETGQNQEQEQDHQKESEERPMRPCVWPLPAHHPWLPRPHYPRFLPWSVACRPPGDGRPKRPSGLGRRGARVRLLRRGMRVRGRPRGVQVRLMRPGVGVRRPGRRVRCRCPTRRARCWCPTRRVRVPCPRRRVRVPGREGLGVRSRLDDHRGPCVRVRCGNLSGTGTPAARGPVARTPMGAAAQTGQRQVLTQSRQRNVHRQTHDNCADGQGHHTTEGAGRPLHDPRARPGVVREHRRRPLVQLHNLFSQPRSSPRNAAKPSQRG